MNNIKDYRDRELKYYVIGNILVIFLASGAFNEIFSPEISDNLYRLETFFGSMIISSVVYIYVFLIDSVIPGDVKQKITYFPIGKLPGYTIFTKMKEEVQDNRFTKDDIMKVYSEIYANMPSECKEKERYENSQWYIIYQRYRNEEEILVSNRDYLLCRDITIITGALIVSYIMLCLSIENIRFYLPILVFMILEIIISDIAMRGKAKRLVYNIIAEDVSKRISQ